VKVFEAPEISKEALTKYFDGQVQREGLISKRDLETFEGFSILYRPFREITWILESSIGTERKTSVSFIDEQLSSIISDSDHRFLLWRPRYANLETIELEENEVAYTEIDNTEAVENVVNDLMRERWTGQELDEELRPKLRSLQADPLTSIALIVPRSPHGLKREEAILVERSEVHSFVLASSLVTNCSPKDIMLSAVITEQVFVKTIVAKYRANSDKNLRLLFLEISGSSSLRDAKKSGLALTRICQLYPDFIGIIG
jgi:hypothetical protein